MAVDGPLDRERFFFVSERSGGVSARGSDRALACRREAARVEDLFLRKATIY
jgi:hypothetical protein